MCCGVEERPRFDPTENAQSVCAARSEEPYSMSWIAIKLFLGGMWKRIVDAVTRYPWQTALLAVLLWGLYERNQADKWHKAHDVLKTAVKAQEKASEANLAAAKAQNAKWESTSQDLSEKANEAYDKGLADARSSAARYADTHRVYMRTAPSVSAAPATGQTDPAPRRDGPGEETELVAITREDFDRCTVNSERLEVVHMWGEGLVKAGLAVPDPAFGAQ